MVKAVTPIPFVKARFFDRCGKPLAGGKVYTYEANTTTPKVTYKDPYGLTPNTNPIILDAAGEADIYLDGTYRIRITDKNDVLVNDVEKIGSWFSDNLQDTLDNISVAMDEALKPILQNLDDAINTAAAAGAGANGWNDLLIATSENITQRQINDGLDSIAQLLSIQNPRNGMRVYVKSYHAGLNKGGGTFVYDASKASVNDGGIIINGWLRQDTKQIWVSYFGARGDEVTNDSPAFQKAVDYCEKNQIKTLYLADGNYLLNSAVNIYRGSLTIVGSGSHRQDADYFVNWSNQDYPSMLVGRTGNILASCTITVPKNSTAFVCEKSVSDPICFKDINFLAKGGRTVGNTIVIDYRSENPGPAMNFTLERCYFKGFNKVVNFKADNQYCIAFVKMIHCCATENDEILYFADIPQSKVTESGSRNLAWGLTLEHNNLAGNARILRGCFAKDLVSIRQNNLENSIAYADGTHPKYSIDIEALNCHILYEGNHAEIIRHDLLFVTSLFRKPDGTRHNPANNVYQNGAVTVELKGNNTDGIDKNQFKTVVLEGVKLINTGGEQAWLHGCAVLDDLSIKLPYYCSDEAKTEGSLFTFPVGNYENLHLLNNNDLSVIKNNQYNVNNENKLSIVNSPCGQRQVVKLTNNTQFGTFANWTQVPTVKNAKYFGMSILVHSPKDHVFFSDGAAIDINYTDGGNTTSVSLNPVAANRAWKAGWNILTVIFPRSLVPATATINSVYMGFSRAGLESSEIFMVVDYTTFCLSSDVYRPAPYYISNMQTFYKKGTFERGQVFMDNTGVLNVCTYQGTIANPISPLATGSIGNNYFTVADVATLNNLSVGMYLRIESTTYKVINIVDNVVYLDIPLTASLSNANIGFAEPILSTAALT